LLLGDCLIWGGKELVVFGGLVTKSAATALLLPNGLLMVLGSWFFGIWKKACAWAGL